MIRRIGKDWDRQALRDWIETEKVEQGDSYIQLENALKVRYGMLNWWRLGLADQLSLESIQAIATYRGWTVEQVREWLGLEEEHTTV